MMKLQLIVTLALALVLNSCGDNKEKKEKTTEVSEKTEIAGAGPSATISKKNGRVYQTIDTRIGKLTFENDYLVGIPTKESSEKLFDAIDFQRATQAYIWSIPLMGFYSWKQSFYNEGGEDGQINYFESYDSKLGGVTYNMTTPYVTSYFNVEKQPVIITIPTKEIRGAVHNMWQIGLAQMTKKGKYLIIPKGSKVPKGISKDIKVIESNTNYVFLGLRLMAATHEQRMEDLNAIKITDINGKPLSSKGINKPKMGVDGKIPRGMAFWELLNTAIQTEPVHERDRMVHDMLRPLGIEKGKPFKPTNHQKELLEEAVLVGEMMAKNTDFFKTGRLKQSEYGPKGNFWEIASASTPEQNRGFGMDLDGRAAWFYEALTNDIAMHGMTNGGWGQVYLDNYRDSNGNGLDGGHHYTLTIDGDVNYAETFWTITVYNIENRAIINNKIKRPDVGSSIEGIKKNSDGNYVFHFSPNKPKGVAEANWVQTNPGANWFVYFRAYSPSKEFVAQDPKTILPNFVEVK